jgi:hypothetical protein
MSNDAALALLENAKEAKMWVRQKQKPGAFPEISPLLEARRLEYGIPDGAFNMEAAYGRILVWQLPQDDNDTYGGGLILKTSRTKERERDMAPRGVIVSAGLSALDFLKSNGMDVGHIVGFVRLSPFSYQCDIVGRGIPQELKILQVGDIICSEDLKKALRSGEAKVQVVEEAGRQIHVYVDRDGKRWTPQDPRLASDY